MAVSLNFDCCFFGECPNTTKAVACHTLSKIRDRFTLTKKRVLADIIFALFLVFTNDPQLHWTIVRVCYRFERFSLSFVGKNIKGFDHYYRKHYSLLASKGSTGPRKKCCGNCEGFSGPRNGSTE